MWPVKEYNVIKRNDARIISWIDNIIPDADQDFYFGT